MCQAHSIHPSTHTHTHRYPHPLAHTYSQFNLPLERHSSVDLSTHGCHFDWIFLQCSKPRSFLFSSRLRPTSVFYWIQFKIYCQMKLSNWMTSLICPALWRSVACGVCRMSLRLRASPHHMEWRVYCERFSFNFCTFFFILHSVVRDKLPKIAKHGEWF